MKIVGIIAEYNPFHNGHRYQIARIRELTGADYVAVAMSGNFVQRGAPAIVDKYARTQMALCCGADVVFELPALWACASAEDFAMAGVTLFDRMGCVDTLCFGAETDDLLLLTDIAAILAEEPEPYRTALSTYIKEGRSFPAARHAALQDYLRESQLRDIPDDVLASPNNILVLEYLKALKKRDSRITPLLIRREGAGYHSTELNQPNTSATAIRRLLFSGNVPAALDLENYIPAEALPTLSGYLTEYPPLSEEDFSQALGYQLLSHADTGFSCFRGCNMDISNRLGNNLHDYRGFRQFCERNKSRDITYTRMSRILTQLLLSIRPEDDALGKELDYIPYLRILGFRKESAAVFSRIQKAASIPLISKLADAHRILSPDAMQVLKLDIFASEFYEQTLALRTPGGRTPRSEYAREIVVERGRIFC